MCGCNNFNGDKEFDNFINFDGDNEFDNFLTKKSRRRRKLRKQFQEEGMSKSEARAKAKEQIPREKLLAVLNNLKAKRFDSEGVELAEKGKLPASEPERESTVLNLLADLEGYGSEGSLTDAEKEAFEQKLIDQGAVKSGGVPEDTTPPSNEEEEEGGKNKMMMYVGIGAVVLIGGFFLMKRMGK